MLGARRVIAKSSPCVARRFEPGELPVGRQDISKMAAVPEFSDARAVALCRGVTVVCAAGVAAIGCMGLLGWVLDAEPLKALYTGGISIKANAAACLLFCGVALFLLRDGQAPPRGVRRLGKCLAGVALAVGGLTFSQHLFGWNLGIDQLMFHEPPGAPGTASPGRMGPPASLSFVLAGAALLLMNIRTRRGAAPAQHLAVAGGLIALLPMMGYAYGIQPLYSMSRYTGIAPHTAAAIGALAAGLLCARPRAGLMTVVTGDDAGGAMARRLLPTAVLVPFLFGWLRSLAERRAWLDSAVGRPLMVLSLIVVFSSIIWWNARALARLGRERARSQADRDLLADTSARLLMEDNPSTVMDGLFRRLSDHLAVEVFLNYLVADDGKRLRLNACGGIGPDVCARIEHLDFGQAVCGAVASEQAPRAIENVQACTDNATELIRSLGITAYACQPLLARGRLIGTLSFGSRTRTAFGHDDLELMRTASDQVAVALERRRLAEELRRHAGDLAAANAAKDEFLAVLSHELRTPLTPVLLTTSLLESDARLHPELRDDLATIRRNVELESRLISDLLDLTRVAHGKLQLEDHDVDVHLVVRSAIHICQREASARMNVDLRATRHTVRGDPTRLQQIFWNLINNAQKFTGADGNIIVRSLDAPAGLIRIQVIDTGAGIDPAIVPKLFSAFEQGEVRAARQQAGLGLGLAISRKLAEAHGGTVTVHSAGKGRGATFTVELPLADVPVLAPQAQRPAPKARPAAQPLAVLLVEDHEPTLKVLAKLLRRAGHTVTGAASVASARAAAQQRKFDLLLSDLGLPDGSGLELMRELRADYAGRAIALTGYGMESDVRASHDAGFADHLTKPVDLAALDAAIARVAGANGGATSDPT
jgi:signal transduction histidine kinase/CheY-like chemotaxis protein